MMAALIRFYRIIGRKLGICRPRKRTLLVATFPEIETEIRELVREVEILVALSSTVRCITEDERVEGAYENTYEAHGFVLYRSSLEMALAVGIMRCCQDRRDSHGIGRFFNLLRCEQSVQHLDQGILQRRSQWVPFAQARVETDEALDVINAIRTDFTSLKGRHEYGQMKNFRDKFIAHNTLDRDDVVLPRQEYLHYLLDRIKPMVTRLSQTVLGEGPNFNAHVNNWNMYASRYLDSLIRGME